MATEQLTIETKLTKLLGIKYPIFLAGMNKAAGPKLAAAVTNAGGLGVIGGVGFTPRILKLTIKHLKNSLNDKNAPFGVDLLLPKVGGSARKTNYDYTKGKLSELIDIIIDSGAKLFVSAVGVPPKKIVDKLHDNGILVMNMVGHPKHVPKALAVGVDVICAQGGEGGGHTGDIATTVLLPKVVDLCRQHKSPLTGDNVYVVGAGGIYDGRGLAMALNYGCEAVWVGTRFVASEEAGASLAHKEAVINAGYDDTFRTLIYTGRPMRIIKNEYAIGWHENRRDELERLLAKGVIPYTVDILKAQEMMKPENSGKLAINYAKHYDSAQPHLSGQVAANVNDIKSAKDIVEDMVKEACHVLRYQASRITTLRAKL